MNLVELGALGELVGGVAVVGSLIYVGLQVSQSNRMEMAESIRATTRDYLVTFLNMSPQLVRQACMNFDGMRDDDRQAIHQQMYSFTMVAQTEFYLSERGLIDRDAFRANAAGLVTMLRTPGISRWWEAVHPYFEPGFRTCLEEIAREQEGRVPAFHEQLPWIPGSGAS